MHLTTSPSTCALLFLFLLLHSLAAGMSSSAAGKGASRGALIFLHGLGDTPAGWSQLQFSLPDLRPRLRNLSYVFPAAPTIPIAINGGMKMPGWFDLYDWPIGVGSKDDKSGLLAGVDAIEAEVAKLNEQGIPSERIVVGGFSQGGAVALLAAYRSGTRYAGCAALSGWLTLPSELQVSDEAKKTPLFWGHGEMDDKVLFEQQRFGVDKLREADVDSIVDESYRMGHSSHPKEMESFASFVESAIFGDDDGNELQRLM